MTSNYFGLGLVVALLAPIAAYAQDVRYYEENGITYAETTRKVLRPVTETHVEQRERTVYRQECRTELRDTYRTYQVPVTEYQWEPYLYGRWNPFVQPIVTQRLVPRTRWETRSEVVQVPIVKRDLIPEKRVEQVPIVTRRLVEQPVVSRVAIGRSPSADPFAAQGPSVARREVIGGVSRMESDPPRQGSDTWRPAGETQRR